MVNRSQSRLTIDHYANKCPMAIYLARGITEESVFIGVPLKVMVS